MMVSFAAQSGSDNVGWPGVPARRSDVGLAAGQWQRSPRIIAALN
jgi:hypothetical protein